MGFASKYNRTRKFDIDTNGFEFASVADLYNNNGSDAVYPLRALFINTKGKYNDNPVAATDSFFVDFPSYMTETAREILADDDAVAAINAGKVGFKFYTYTQKRYNRLCYGVEFVDLA
jgi:hypothetical protein